MGRGEKLRVCVECYNASVYARRSERKTQLATYWSEYRMKQAEAMREVGAFAGQRVQYFCRSMLGFCGVLITGRIRINRNGVAVVRLDRIVDGHKETEWSKAWKEVQS